MRERLSCTITVISDRSEKSAVVFLASFLFLRWAVRRRHRRGRIVSLTCSAGAASAVAAWNAGLACRRVGGDPARSLTGSERQFCNMATASTTIAARPRSCAPSRASGRTELYQCSYGRRSTARRRGQDGAVGLGSGAALALLPALLGFGGGGWPHPRGAEVSESARLPASSYPPERRARGGRREREARARLRRIKISGSQSPTTVSGISHLDMNTTFAGVRGGGVFGSWFIFRLYIGYHVRADRG